MNQAVDAWERDVTLLAEHIAGRWPAHKAILDELVQIAGEVSRSLPLAIAYRDLGDGLRSPAIDGGSRSIGTHSDPVLGVVEAQVDGKPTGELQAGAARRRITIRLLRNAITTTDDEIRKRNIVGARDEAASALGVLHRLLPAANTVKRLQRVEPGGCVSCRRAGFGGKPFFEPTRSPGGTFCEWCERLTASRRNEWIEAHPGQAVPDDRRFWPPKVAVEWRRDHGHKRITQAQWAAWEAADREARKPRRRKRSA